MKRLHELFRDQQVKKTYLCVVKGRFLEAERQVTAPLRKFQLANGERLCRADPQGKPAETTFTPEKVFAKASLLRAEPKTGRTHQIRVHAKVAGYPIMGDDKYGDYAFNKACNSLGCKRLMLHAYQLEIPGDADHPAINVVAPLPASWQDCIQQLGEQA